MSSTIQIEVNGEHRAIEAGTTVRGLCVSLGLSGPVAVERNMAIVPRAQQDNVVLAEGDVLELVQLVGGG